MAKRDLKLERRENLVRALAIKEKDKVALLGKAAEELEGFFRTAGAETFVFSDTSIEGVSPDLVVAVDAFIRTEDQKTETDKIRKIKESMAPGATLFIAFKNRFSMRNFSGTDPDHSFVSERTFSLKDMKERLGAAGITDIQTYYPYPDHIYPMTIFSDEFLPIVGELYKGEFVDRSDINFFDDIKAYDEVIKEGAFPFFSPSYILICRI